MRGLLAACVGALVIGSAAPLPAGSGAGLAAPSGSAQSAQPGVAGISSPTPARTASVAWFPPGPLETPTARPTAPTPLLLSQSRVNSGTEPTLSVDPFDPSVVAVIAQEIDWTRICSRPDVSISRDGGLTWSVAALPFGSTCGDIHAVIAWGMGSTPGSARLYAADAVPVDGGLALAIVHSDDFGASWSSRYVQGFTTPWVGCFPVLAVDNSPASPNYGTVYAAYNYLAGPNTVSMSVLASKDGKNWVQTAVRAVGLAGYAFTWAFGERLAIAADGSIYISFYESDMHALDKTHLFIQNTQGNIGRAGFVTARVYFTNGELTSAPAKWAIGVVPSDRAAWNPEDESALVVGTDGDLWLAVSDRPAAGGRIRVGSSDDGGTNWYWTTETVPDENSFRASLAVWQGKVFLAWHTQDARAHVRTYYTLSYDNGVTYLPPTAMPGSYFYLPNQFNDTGLRENAEFMSGLAYYTWGDARSGVAVYMAVIRP